MTQTHATAMLSQTAKMEVSLHFNVSSTSTWSKRCKKRERGRERGLMMMDIN